MISENNSLYSFDQFTLDGKSLALLRDGELVRLQERPIQKKPMRILLVLVERAGQVVTRDEIVTVVWGGPDGPQDGTIDGYIHKLRQALGQRPEGGEYIETLPGRGYWFAAKVSKLDRPQAPPQIGHGSRVSLEEPERKAVQADRLLPCLSARIKLFGLLAFAVVAGLGFWLTLSGQQQPKIVINEDASWSAEVPTIAAGVRLESNGHRLTLNPGDAIEVRAKGVVDIGRGPVGPDGEPNYMDNTMDSPFKDRVGGLEMWIGTDKSANRYFIGSEFEGIVKESGVLTFRIIESNNGYGDDNNSGAFVVTVRKVTRQQPQIDKIITLSTPSAGQQFYIQLVGSGIDPDKVRVVVTGRGCESFGSCVVPNYVLHWYGAVTTFQLERVPLTLAPGSFEVFVQNGTNAQASTSLTLAVPLQ